jgi:hypothetical protein
LTSTPSRTRIAVNRRYPNRIRFPAKSFKRARNQESLSGPRRRYRFVDRANPISLQAGRSLVWYSIMT